MNEILSLFNSLTADELDKVLTSGRALLEKKRREEAEQAQRKKIEDERKRQQEIAELQRRLQELQKQAAASEEKKEPVSASKPEYAESTSFRPASQQAAASKPAEPTPQPVICPYCSQSNTPGSLFCINCGQKMVLKHQPAPKPSPAPAPASSVRPASAQIRYAGEDMKKWEKLPGEKTERGLHEIKFIEPEKEKRMVYFMEVTNKRLLISREGLFAANAGLAFGIVGHLASNAAKKPYLEIPLTAITNYGLISKKEFLIEAGERFVLKNNVYDRTLPQLIENAKNQNR